MAAGRVLGSALFAMVVSLALVGAAVGETCIGNSTLAEWEDDNVLSVICAESAHALMSNGTEEHYFRAAIELPQTINAELAELTITAVAEDGVEHTATASEEELIVTVCFSSNATITNVTVSANEEYLADHFVRYAFYYDENASATSCPDAPPNQIYDYFSSAHDGPDDDQDCTCNGHGTCSDLDNYCLCDENWFGLQCQLYCSPEETCSGFGRCHMPDARCQCNDCYFGDNCQFVDPECLHLHPTPTPVTPEDCPVCEDCSAAEPMSIRSLIFFIVVIGLVVILTAACLIYFVVKKVRRFTEKKDYIPASILDEEEIDW